MLAAEEKPLSRLPDIHRGLTNEIGENNCFLNVTIQALWHLSPFRVELQKFIAKIEAGKSNNQKLTPGSLLESMCNLFVQYQFTDQKVLPPNELRESLSHLSGKYEFGKIADANETLDTILHRIHTEQSATCPNMKKCLSHKVFGGLVMEQTICGECRGSSEPTLRDDFMTCFQAMELITEAKEMARARSMLKPMTEKEQEQKENKEHRSKGIALMPKLFGKKSPEPSSMTTKPPSGNFSFDEHADLPITGMKSDFGYLLHRCMEVSQRSCPANEEPDRPKDQPLCKGKGKVCFFSLEPPMALALSVGWTQANEDAKTLRDFYSIISDRVMLCDLFSGTGGHELNGPSYTFRGLVCYYGLHYVSFFQEMGRERFLLFDDQKVRVVGDWKAVKEECIKSKYQPVLLLYELNKVSAYLANTESDDELELVMSEKARTSTREQKVRIENNDSKGGSEDLEVESKTGDPFVLTTSLSPDSTVPATATVATVVMAPSAVENLIDLSPSAEDSKAVGPFTSPERAKPNVKTVTLQTGSAPHIIAAIPMVSEQTNHSRQSIGNNRSSSNDNGASGAGHHQSGATANVVSNSNTTFGTDMFAPQEDSHMSSLIAPPSIGLPVKAEAKSGPFTSSDLGPGHYHHAPPHHHPPHHTPHHPPPHGGPGAKHAPSSSSSSGLFSELSGSASQTLLQTLHMAPQQPHLVIDKWSHRPLRYNVVLSQELLGNGLKSVGVNIAPGADGKPIVSGFFRHPGTGKPLPAERSGLIEAGDRIVTVNDIELREYDLDLLRSILLSCDSVTFTMASCKRKNLWYTCPRCTISNIVDEDTEARLKSFNKTRRLNEMKRGATEQTGYLMRCVMCRSENMADASIHD